MPIISTGTESRFLLLFSAISVFVLSCQRLDASDPIGFVSELSGSAVAIRELGRASLSSHSKIHLRDTVVTGNNSSVELTLGKNTTVRLGAKSQLLIDKFLASSGGEFDLSRGAVMFESERPGGRTAIRTVYGLIGVRGTRVFAGPSRGVFGVFVEKGVVAFEAQGIIRYLSSGEGLEISAPGVAPGQKGIWSTERISDIKRQTGYD